MKRIIITGATGFVGRNCVPLFAADPDWEVHALDLCRGDSDAVVWHEVDLSEIEKTRAAITQIQPTHLLHLAWFVPPKEFWSSSENAAWVDRSFELLKSFAESGGERAVLVGSCAEYDWSGNDLCDEAKTALNPSTLYGIAKAALFRLSEKYAQTANLSFAWARLFFMFGEGEADEKFVAYMIKSLLKGEKAVCRNPDLVRDYLYVKEVAAALKMLLESEVRGAVNVASGTATRVGDLAKTIGDIVKRSDLIEFSEKPNRDEPPFIVAKIRRLTEEVGWRRQQSLEDSLREYIGNFRRSFL